MRLAILFEYSAINLLVVIVQKNLKCSDIFSMMTPRILLKFRMCGKITVDLILGKIRPQNFRNIKRLKVTARGPIKNKRSSEMSHCEALQ